MPFGGLLSRRPSSRKSRESGVYYYSTPTPQYHTTNDDRGSIYSGTSSAKPGVDNAAFQAANAAALGRSKPAKNLSSNAAAAALKKHSSMTSLQGISAYNAGLGSRPQSQQGLAAGRTMSLSSRSFRPPDSPSVQRRTSSFQPGAANPYLSTQRQPSLRNPSRANSLSSRSSLRPGPANNTTASRSNSITSNSSRARGPVAGGSSTTTTTTTTTTKPTATGGTSTTIVRTTKEQDAEGRTKSITKTTIQKLGSYEVVKTTVIKPSERPQTRHSNAAAASYAGSILSDHTNDLESITEEFDPEFYQDFDESPNYINPIDDIVYEEPEEEPEAEPYYEDEYIPVPASPIPSQQQRTLNLVEATKDSTHSTPLTKKRISSSASSSAHVSPVILKNEFESSPITHTANDNVVDDVYDSYHEDEVLIEKSQEQNGATEDMPTSTKTNQGNVDGTHSYRKLTQTAFDKPNVSDYHHSNSPVRSILKKPSNVALSVPTTSGSDSTNPTFYENDTNKTSFSNGSSEFTTADSASNNTKRKQIKKMHVDYDEESDDSVYSDAVEDLKASGHSNNVSQTFKDSEKVTEEVRSYQSPNLVQRAAFRQQTQHQLQQPHRVRSNSINSYNSSTMRKSVKISDNTTEIKTAAPAVATAPRKEMTDAEMMEQAMAIAMKKVYGDRLIVNDNAEADISMDSDTQKNTLLNSKASSNGRAMSMTSQSYSLKPNKNDRAMSMTSQTASAADGSINNNYHYASNATGLGFRTHSLREMPNTKEMKKLNKQKEKEEAKKRKEIRNQQKQDAKNMAKARQQAKTEVDIIHAHEEEIKQQQELPQRQEQEQQQQQQQQQHFPVAGYSNPVDQGSVIETPVVTQKRVTEFTPSEAPLTGPIAISSTSPSIKKNNISPEEQKKKKFFSFGSKKKDKSKDKVQTPSAPPSPAKPAAVSHRLSVASRSSFSQPSNAATQRVPASPKKPLSKIFSKQEKPPVISAQENASSHENKKQESPRNSSNYITMAIPDGSQKFEAPPSLISKDSLQIQRDDVDIHPSNENDSQAQRKANVGSKIMKLFNL